MCFPSCSSGVNALAAAEHSSNEVTVHDPMIKDLALGFRIFLSAWRAEVDETATFAHPFCIESISLQFDLRGRK
jgi:hypothetical protein